MNHLDRDWLELKYIVEGLSTYEIGRLVGRDPKCVYTQLRKFGIPTRPRGKNLSQGGRDNYMAQPDAIPTFAGRTHAPETKAKISAAASKPKPHLRGERNGMFGRRGEGSTGFRHGQTPERQRTYSRAEWRAAVRMVQKRDGGACQRCGSKSRRMHLHHIAGFDARPDLRCDPDNIVTLCTRCHGWVHSRKNVGREFLA